MLTSCNFNDPYKEVEHYMRDLKTEEEVRSRFGKARYTFYSGVKDYYVDGYSYKERTIEHKVEIIFPKVSADQYTDVILYVYYDKDENVTDYYVGGS